MLSLMRSLSGAPVRISVAASFLLSMSVSGCSARSEEQLQAQFDAVVARSNSCANDQQCLVISPGCPLGCWVTVKDTAAESVKETARDLIDEYESGGQGCAYGCTPKPGAACVNGRCALIQGTAAMGSNTADSGTTTTP